METDTVGSSSGTGSKTLADLASLAATRYGGKSALRRKVGDAWMDVTYDDLALAVQEIALGLSSLGLGAEDRVAILSHTRPEWTYANLGILQSGAASVSVYQTNSPEECHYVLHHSEARAVFVEDAEQLAKIRAVESRLPALEFLIVFEPSGENGNALSLDALRDRGRGGNAHEVEERARAVSPDDPCVYIYTSGTTGPPKGCILTHGNYRAMVEMVKEPGALAEDELVYLFLPLAHAFALLIQFVVIELGGTIAYWEKDPQKIVANLIELKPTYFPSVPRIFEKIYTLAHANAPDEQQMNRAIEVGLRVRALEERGEQVPSDLRAQFDKADQALFQNVRALFGGRIRQCVTGAAPIAREILEFFYACGVPVMEGYGMTETATSATCNLPTAYRLGSVGRPFRGVQVRVAEDGEVLLKGENIFKGYYRNKEATADALVDSWLHTGDLGRLDEDGYLYITGRKKDLIITAGGKNITPSNIENGLKAARWVSQAVVLGDRRPYLIALITLDPEEAPAFAAERGLSVDDLPQSSEMRAELQRVINEVNARVGKVEQVKKFTILPRDLSQETGELTPTLKVKRNVVTEKYAGDVDALYAG